MKLYHYTSVKSFKKIWESQSLKFSDSKRTNDIFERRKFIQNEGVPFPREYKPNSKGNRFFKHFFDILYSYRQISLCMDYADGLAGCESPMMWGQYANSSKGVCIEFDSEKLNINKRNVWAANVEYSNITPIVFRDVIFAKDEEINMFIEERINDIFFKKHFHWQFENEYRIVSNKESFLSVKDAIKAIYVPDNKNYAFRTVDELIKGSGVEFYYIIPTTSKRGRKISFMDVETVRRCKRQFEEKITLTVKEILNET